VGGIRSAAIVVLSIVAAGGAAVAGVEKALQEPAVVAAAPPPPVVVADEPEPAPPLRGRTTPPPCDVVTAVCVQLSTSSAWLRSASLGPVAVRVGRTDSPTPVGTFTVQSKRADHVSSLDGTPMPFAVFFADDVALYQGDLTQPSAGSVRLPAGAAPVFFDAVEPGDVVQVVP